MNDEMKYSERLALLQKQFNGCLWVLAESPRSGLLFEERHRPQIEGAYERILRKIENEEIDKDSLCEDIGQTFKMELPPDVPFVVRHEVNFDDPAAVLDSLYEAIIRGKPGDFKIDEIEIENFFELYDEHHEHGMPLMNEHFCELKAVVQKEELEQELSSNQDVQKTSRKKLKV